MMKKIVFATNNKNKLREVQEMLSDYTICTPSDMGITEDIPETSATIEGNASQKSMYIYEKTGVDCFADDTGLEVEALNGAPGVYSARYAGEGKRSEDNIALLLHNMDGQKNRKARFKTVISLIYGGNEYLFEGIVNGEITTSRHGGDGFGYDPIFRPEGYKETFAEMTLELKNKISHRGIAVHKLINHLQTLFAFSESK